MRKFCPGCGKARNESASFCSGCGLRLNPAAGTVPTPQNEIPAMKSSLIKSAKSEAREPLKDWQVVVGDELPAFAVPDRASADESWVIPINSKDHESESAGNDTESLAGRAWSLLFLNGLDMITAFASQDPGALANLPLRAATVGAAWFFGITAGASRGFSAFLMAISSLVLCGLQGLSLYQLSGDILGNPEIAGPVAAKIMALFAGGSPGSLLETIANDPGLLSGAWMNVVTQGIAMVVAFNAFRACRR